MFTASNKALFGRCAVEPSRFGVQPHDLADREDRRRLDPRRRSFCRGLNQRADHDPLFRIVDLRTIAAGSAGSRPGSISRRAIRARLPVDRRELRRLPFRDRQTCEEVNVS